MDAFWKEVRQTLRSLLANRKFATLTIAILALTIAGVTIVFTLVHSTLLKPLPYPNADQLVILWERQPNLPTLRTVRTASFMDWRDRSHSFEAMALYRPFVYDIESNNARVRVQVWSVSPELFPMLDGQTVIGRGLRREDEQPGAPSVALISYEFWHSRYGGTPDVVGRTLQFPQNANVTIVGVMTPGFRPPLVSAMVPDSLDRLRSELT